MHTIEARNVNEAWPKTLRLIANVGMLKGSRNGPVMSVQDPVSVRYENTRERVLFCEERRINPWLHFFEPFWILAGQEDVEFLANIVPGFRNYSDDGKTFAAAYGQRMRIEWDDQIGRAIERLKADPDDRRTVLMIRDPVEMWYTGKDCACNIAIALKIVDHKLDFHVFNRSNDVVWGGPAGGANYPQFTVLAEYIANKIGIDVGVYHQTTNDMHAYVGTEVWGRVKDVRRAFDPYASGQVRPFPLAADEENWDEDLYEFFRTKSLSSPRTTFFREVFMPMWYAFLAYKEKDYRRSHKIVASSCKATDWSTYTQNWLSTLGAGV